MVDSNLISSQECTKDGEFASLALSSSILKSLEEMGMRIMTPVQARCIPAALAGHDVLGAARTGSGKTLAFLIPTIELLLKARFTTRNGTGVIILTPTRELALQIQSVATCLLKSTNLTFGSVIGGNPRDVEAAKLAKGVNLVIATPGRLLDHIRTTKDFIFRNLRALVIDEADRILEVGFEDQLNAIIKALDESNTAKDRQTLLFSATQTTKVDELARASMKGKPVYINVEEDRKVTTAENLEQGYVVCPSENRFMLLFTFLKKYSTKKVIVFFSSCDSVKYHADLLNYIDIPVLELHGKKSQSQRTSTFFDFVNASSGILLCTNVAARGLDIPAVDWIVQYDPSDDARDYIHRVGRTARAGASGRALLFLLPTELAYLKILREAGVPLSEYSVPASKLSNIQSQLDKLVSRNYHLNNLAKSAFRSYMRSYNSHSLKNIFTIETLDLTKVARSFGLSTPPHFALPGDSNDRKNIKKQKSRDFQGQKKRKIAA